MLYSLLFHSNNFCTNSSQSYVIRKLPVLQIITIFSQKKQLSSSSVHLKMMTASPSVRLAVTYTTARYRNEEQWKLRFHRWYLLIPWCRVLLEKLTGLQLVKKFPAIYGTLRFNTALTSVRHLSLSWASPIQSTYPHPTSRRSILILFTHLRLGLPSGLFPFGFPTKTLYAPLSSPIRATCPAHLILLDVITRTIFTADKTTKYYNTHGAEEIVFPVVKCSTENLMGIKWTYGGL